MKWFPSECKRGDIIRVRVGSLYHYGIFVSEGEIIQFGGRPDGFFSGGFMADASGIKVCTTDIQGFSGGDIIEVGSPEKSERKKLFSPDEIIRRARSRLGEGGYDIIHNNCEHFVNLCAFGESKSEAVSSVLENFAKRPVLKVYLAPAQYGSQPLYPEERDKEVASVSNEGVRAEKYAVWQTLGYALKQAFGADICSLEFKKSAHGKWSTDKYFFSLSHSNGVVCAAVSNAPVGVDIEEKESFNQRICGERGQALFNKIATRREKKKGGVTGEKLLDMWLEKESVFKLGGKGVFSPGRVECGRENVSFFTAEAANKSVRICCCGKHAAAAEIYILSGENNWKSGK